MALKKTNKIMKRKWDTKKKPEVEQKVEIQFGQMQHTTVQINPQRNCLPNNQDHSLLYRRLANQSTNFRSRLHGSPSTQLSTSHTLHLMWYLYLNNSCKNPTIELLILLIKPRYKKWKKYLILGGEKTNYNILSNRRDNCLKRELGKI